MYCIVLYFKTMDSSKVSLSLCGENVLYIGCSIAHHCNFNTLRSATGAHITTRKAYGTVFDENMFFPHSNLTDVAQKRMNVHIGTCVKIRRIYSFWHSVLKQS